MTISACLILRDCEKTVINCLGSIVNKVDEIICIIDSRTVDSTAEVCLHYTPHVYHYEWINNSVASARNYAISKASMDWIFNIDDDEEITKWEKPNEDFDYALVTVNNKIGERITIFRAARLFRNYRGVEFKGIKQAIPDESFVKNGLKGYESEIEIMHYGYDLTAKEQVEKNNINLQVHLKMLDAEPDNISNKYYLAQTYFGLKDYANAVKFGALAIDDKLNRELKASLCITMFLSYNFLNDLSIAKLWLMKSFEYIPNQILGRVLAMQVYKNEKEYEKAREQLKIIELINQNKISMLPNDSYYTEDELLNFKTELEKCHTTLAQ